GLGILIGQPANQQRAARGGAQPAQRIQRAPPRRGGARIGEAHQLGDRRAGAQPPRLEQGLVDGRRRGFRRSAGDDFAQGARAFIAAGLRDGRYRLDLPRAGAQQQRRNRAGLLEQAERKGGSSFDVVGRIVECRQEQIDRRGVADAPRRERALATDRRIGVAQRLPQRRGVEAPRIGGGQQVGEDADGGLVGGDLRRGRRRHHRQQNKEGGEAKAEPGPPWV